MLGQAWSIATNTFREAIRNRVLHAIVLLSFGLVVSSLAIGELSVENNARVIRDVGVAFVHFTVVLVAIFSGVSLLQVELQRKTIYTIVTKPVARGLFIVGKYLGLGLTLAVVQLLLVVVFGGVVLGRGDPFPMVMVQSMGLIFVEGLVLASLATLFSSFSTPLLSGLLTFGMFVLGRLRGDLYVYAERMMEGDRAGLGMLLKGAGVLLPDLTLHQTNLEVAYLVPLTWSYVGYSVVYSVMYVGVCLALSVLIFSRRDFV